MIAIEVKLFSFITCYLILPLNDLSLSIVPGSPVEKQKPRKEKGDAKSSKSR